MCPWRVGVSDSALFYPEGKGSWPAVLMWTDILGLRPVFREMGQRLAAEGYVVLVPNPFYRNAKAPVVDGSFDFSKPEDRAKVMPMAAALTADANISDAKVVRRLSRRAAANQQEEKDGCPRVLHGRSADLSHGSHRTRARRRGCYLSWWRPGDRQAGQPAPADPEDEGRVCSAAVADNDDKRDPTAKDTLKEAFAAAHLKATVEVYEGCNHGWTVRGSQVYNEAGAERAWAELTALYKRNLS